MKNVLFLLLAITSLAFFIPQTSFAQSETTDKTIVEVAAGNSDFTTLVAAVKAAGLAETLMGEGPFTVFAPTNTAFENLPAGLVTALLKPENKATLQKILTYHVVSGNLMAKDVVAAITAGDGVVKPATVEGTTFSVTAEMGKVQITDGQGNVANVTSTDITGSNGVIHVIDRILLPVGVDPAALLAKESAEEMPAASMKSSTEDAGPTIAAIASGNKDFKTLTAALGAAGLVETFDSPGEYTVFAPTDAAFGALPEGTVNSLVTDQKDQLKSILAYHVITAKITAAQLVKAIQDNDNYYLMQTLGGQTIVATIKGGNVQLIDAAGNRATVIVTDVMASNGIIHGIDAVVMPK
ncbi:MAG: putative surface protein with fasciclin (FAS1) repeats [Neolewinella sp.]|jgi:uncharacterized surface protein with fasciclin (FAS1) repeats